MKFGEVGKNSLRSWLLFKLVWRQLHVNNMVIVPCRCEELCVKFGEVGKNSLPAQLHFNPDIGNLEVLVTTNAYCDKESKEYLGIFKQQFVRSPSFFPQIDAVMEVYKDL